MTMKQILSLLTSFPFLVNGEKTWLSRFPAIPDPKTMEVVHFLTVPENHDPEKPAEVSLAAPFYLNLEPGTNLDIVKGVELSIIPHYTLQALTGTVDENGATHVQEFCCNEAMKNENKCGEKGEVGKLAIDGAMSFTIDKTNIEANFVGQSFKLAKSGLYYVTLSNCSDVKYKSAIEGEGVKFNSNSGELVFTTEEGFLPGEEKNKMTFYLYLCLAYLSLLALWGVWCKSWSDVLFKIHHYITIVIVVGVLEAAAWYISLFHWNVIGHRWWSMIALASFGTVVKQGVSYGLLLLACLGLGVTRPSLEKSQIFQCSFLVIAFIITDGLRQMLLLDSRDLNSSYGGLNDSSWKLILLVTPGSLFVSILYVWIFQSLQDTIQNLQDKKQTVKLEVYTNLRLALCFVCALVCALLGYEMFIMKGTDLASNWSSRYIFTDVLSHACFYFLLLAIMVLWKPSERSQQMVYSEEMDLDGFSPVGNGGDVELGECGGDLTKGEVEDIANDYINNLESSTGGNVEIKGRTPSL